MTKKKIIKYNNKSYTFYRDEDGNIHPEGDDFESAEYLIKNRDTVVWYIAKKMKWELPKKEIQEKFDKLVPKDAKNNN